MNRGRDRSTGSWQGQARAAAALVLVGAMPGAAGAQQAATPAPSLVFDRVTVVDVERGKLVPNQRVVITGNRIHAVGGSKKVSAPTGARVVDGRGKYLIPGLWDLHIHPDRFDDWIFPVLLVNGVTGIRNAGSQMPLDGMMQMRQEILAGTRVGPPRQILSGQSIDGPNPECRRISRGIHTCVGDTADVRRMVDSVKVAGVDMIKMYELEPATYFAIAAEARRVGIRFGGHAENVTAIEAAQSGASLIDHFQVDLKERGLYQRCWGADSGTGKILGSVERCRPIAEQLRRNNTWWVPTFAISYEKGRCSKPITDRLREYFRGDWVFHGNWLQGTVGGNAAGLPCPGPMSDATGGNLRIAKQVGLPIAAGTDMDPGTRPGFSVPAEIAMYAAEGLTPAEALRTATLNPAKMLRGTDSLGTVAPGKLADLVLLDGDPLADITNVTAIRAVVANGRYFDRAALDSLLAETRVKQKNWQP